MKTTAIIERGNDGTYGIYLENNKLPFGIIGDGKTSQEAIEDFYNSRDEMETYYKEINKDFPENLEFEFKYDMASFLNYYSKYLSLAGLSRLTGVNQGQLSHYVTGYRKPSKETVRKIESSLKNFAEEIKDLSFIS